MRSKTASYEISPLTIKALIYNSIDKYPSCRAVSYYDSGAVTYRELGEKINAVGNLLREKGIRKGDKVAILGDNSPNWGIAYLSIVTMGAVAVPILPEFPAEDIIHIIKHSESKILFATKGQMEKIAFEDCHQKCKLMKAIIILDDFVVEKAEIDTLTFSEMFEEAYSKATGFIQDLKEKTGIASSEIEEEDLAAIIYTSGTTGLSKGVMLTHKNIVSNLIAISYFMSFSEKDRFMSILPLSHAFECTLGFLLPLANGSSIYYLGRVPNPTLLKKACEKVHPTAICMVPLVIEKLYKKRVVPVFNRNFLIRALTRTPFIKQKLYRKAVSKIIESLGGELRVVAIGGAPLNSEVEDFLIRGGFPFVHGYGLTEAAPLVTGESLDEIRRGSPGYPISGVEVKIDNPEPETGIGEILVKGPNVMKGYYKNHKLTEEVFTENGWFHTGDKGYFDKNGFIHIRGRSKNMFLGPNGENIYPEVIEEKIASSMIVQETLVIENRGDVEALIYLDPDVLEPLLEEKTEKEQEEIINGILEEIQAKANENLPNFCKIKKCFCQSEPFVKTATHKIKRYLYYHPENA